MSDTNSWLSQFLHWLSGAPKHPARPSTIEDDHPVPPDAGTPAQSAEKNDLLTQVPPPQEGTEMAPAPMPASDSDPMIVFPQGSVLEEPINDATAYGVEIVPADIPPGTHYWRVIRVHHLTSEENHGNHHIFLDALDEGGDRVFDAQAMVSWDGGQQSVAVDKPLSEPGANFPMWKWQVCRVEMLGLPSDQVVNLHTAHADEPPGDGNTLFHHSFQLDFQRAVKGALAEPTLPADKLLERYALFGPPTSSRTTVFLTAAQDFLASQQPTFGFQPEDASQARQVIIIGEPQDVDQATADALVAAGCSVTRIQGTPVEVRAALEDLGQDF